MAVEAAGKAIEAVRSEIANAIRRASDATGSSFDYLLSTAKMESNFTPRAAASTSSARGLFQFIDQTWLGTVKEAGAALGYGKYADAITKTSSGQYTVSDPSVRKDVLALRDDPAAASAMAGALTRSNSFRLTGLIGRRPTDGELYMAHFMGVSGAAKLINAVDDKSRSTGAAMFPTAASANRSIFYERGGSARSVSEVYDELNSRYADAAKAPTTRAVAALASPVGAQEIASSDPQFATNFPASTSVAGTTAVRPGEPLFRGLFQVGARTDPVAPAVRELWGNGVSLTSLALPKTNAKGNQPLDLFSDRDGTFSG